MITPQTRYNRLALGILVAGLLSAALVFTHTNPEEYQSGVVAFEMDGGKVSAIDPDDLKRNRQDSWTRANGHAAEFDDWAVSWTHGRRSAYTLAGLSVAGSLVCLFLANFEFEVAPPKKASAETAKN